MYAVFVASKNTPQFIDAINDTGYGIIAEKPRVGHLPRFFSVVPVRKTMRWLDRKKD